MSTPTLALYYATETGNAEPLASQACERALNLGWNAHLFPPHRRTPARARVIHRLLPPLMKTADTESARFTLSIAAALALLAAFIAALHLSR